MRLTNEESQPILVAFTDGGVPKTGLSPQITIYKASDGSNVTPQSNLLTEIGTGIYKYPAANLPLVSNEVLVFAIDGGVALSNQDRYKFGALLFGGYPNELLTGQADITSTVNNIESKMVVGSGTTVVNHNYGGVDNLRVVDENSSGVENANIYAYRKVDWDNNLRTAAYVKGWSMTDGEGRWNWSIYLEVGAYYLVVDAPLYEQQSLKEVNVG